MASNLTLNEAAVEVASTKVATKDTVIIAAGGTGGHVFPALAVADALRKRDVDVVWIGTERGIEYKVVPEWGYSLRLVNVTALRGRGLLSRIRSGMNLISAIRSSVQIIRTENPRAVLGMGGYVSGPVCMAARLCGRRMVVHEQNAVAGFTNMVLKRFATRVMEAMPGTFSTAVGAVHTGNPVREDILSLPSPDQRISDRGDYNSAATRILVIGGSQGAKALNEIVPAAIALLDNAVVVRHQSGEKWQQATAAAYKKNSQSVEVSAFVGDMAGAYEWADLIICRSGAMTVAEIAAVGLAAILVPYPSAVDDHQTANGEFLVNAGAALMVPESGLTAESLAQTISELLKDKSLLLKMANNGRAASRRDATQLVVNEILGAAA